MSSNEKRNNTNPNKDGLGKKEGGLDNAVAKLLEGK